MSSVTVTTPEELKKAIKEKRDKIIVTGKLANKVKKAERMKKLSPVVLSMIAAIGAAGTAGMVAAPVTGGTSLAFTAALTATLPPVAAASGLSIPVLIIISIVGVATLSILFDEYTHIEIEHGKVVFERKHKNLR